MRCPKQILPRLDRFKQRCCSTHAFSTRCGWGETSWNVAFRSVFAHMTTRQVMILQWSIGGPAPESDLPLQIPGVFEKISEKIWGSWREREVDFFSNTFDVGVSLTNFCLRNLCWSEFHWLLPGRSLHFWSHGTNKSKAAVGWTTRGDDLRLDQRLQSSQPQPLPKNSVPSILHTA